MFTLTLPPLVADAATGRALADGVPSDAAAHVEIDASLVELGDHGFVGELLDGLLARGLEVLVVGGASHDLRSSFARGAEHRAFDEIWFQTDTAA
ncbi:hypothetical protein EDF46_0440 [Frondihabitans sp. PhB188]|uniref:hypothetical protein n=1 Tax=Frondihabitans sp. PhB188 TaxID=2485200 RepID=UPI000F480E78|nr:hypothetical protein [Frondihabitans sp. PhB188]ROQ41073.1 hypothetical protein EDF46_0440 [Frondihabitans sp. PhB188]